MTSTDDGGAVPPGGDCRARMDSPVGTLTLEAGVDGLTGIYFPGHAHRRLDDAGNVRPRDPAEVAGPDLTGGESAGPDPAGSESGGPEATGILGEARRQLDEYFAGHRTVFDLPLAPAGEDFQLRVWALLHEILYGQTRTYGQLAAELGDPHLARAVGAANGRNPLSIVVPCHRVIGADGRLVGYGGGLDRKRFLLALEEPRQIREGRLF